ASGHATRLDKQNVAADRRPGETNGYSWPPSTLRHFHVGPEPGRAEKLLHALGCDFRAFGFALGDTPRALPADTADLPFQAAHAGFARVAANQMTHGFIGEVNATFLFEPVLFRLPGNQIPERDDQFFLLGITLELDDLHAVAQGLGNGIEHVGRSDKQYLRQIEGNVEVVVTESRVLFRIQNFEQRRSGVAAKVSP